MRNIQDGGTCEEDRDTHLEEVVKLTELVNKLNKFAGYKINI